MKRCFIILLSLFLFFSSEVEARKIKNSFTIRKDSDKNKKSKDFSTESWEIILNDSIGVLKQEEMVDTIYPSSELLEDLKNITFTGYDKEPSSNVESFIMVNGGHHTILGFKVRINYFDMQHRMFHSRIVEESCEVPEGEARRIDIKGWDKQHTYYYYLGNEPKKVATPFQVEFTPVSFRVAYD